MVWLSGPRRGVGRVKLHDPPPGYRPPRRVSPPLTEQRRRARRDWAILHVAVIVLVMLAVAFMVIMFVIIATNT
jgi:hypothetical protein